MTPTAAIIVTYNRLEKLKKCVRLLMESETPCDIIIVNNASTDGTGEWLQAIDDDRVSVVNQEVNVGGAGGFSIGVRKGVEIGYDYIWMMDDDCMVRPDSLTRLLEADTVLGGDYGWLSSIALWTDGSPCAMNRQKVSADFYRHADLLKDSLLESTQATFVSLFVPARTITRFGLPIKEFFIWGDDVEFTRRVAVRGGVRSFIVGDSLVTHEMGDNNGSSIATDGEKRIARYWYAYRNEAYLFRKEGVRGVAYFTAKCLLNACRIIFKARDCRMRRLATLIKGAVSGIFFNPKVEFCQARTQGKESVTR